MPVSYLQFRKLIRDACCSRYYCKARIVASANPITCDPPVMTVHSMYRIGYGERRRPRRLIIIPMKIVPSVVSVIHLAPILPFKSMDDIACFGLTPDGELLYGEGRDGPDKSFDKVS